MLFSCNSREGKINVPDQADTTKLVANGLEVEPEIRLTDSMEILYYKYTEDDSLRYSRFYTYTATSDTTELEFLKKQLSSSYSLLTQVRDCRSQGKIHLFSGGEPVKTIYFSQTGDQCNYLYFIRNGNFFYFPLSEDFSEFLEKNKKFARQP